MSDMTASGETLTQVVILLRQALELLDQAGAPADIGAHLDFTINRVQELIGLASGGEDLGDCGGANPH